MNALAPIKSDVIFFVLINMCFFKLSRKGNYMMIFGGPLKSGWMIMMLLLLLLP